MVITRSTIIRTTTFLFGVTTGALGIYLGPIRNYDFALWYHVWIHIIMAFIAIFASFSLYASTIYCKFSIVLFILWSLGTFPGHQCFPNFIPLTNSFHIILAIPLLVVFLPEK